MTFRFILGIVIVRLLLIMANTTLVHIDYKTGLSTAVEQGFYSMKENYKQLFRRSL